MGLTDLGFYNALALLETVRYTHLQLKDRLCMFCSNNSIEDEFHFLCECSKYAVLRKKKIIS